MLKGGRKLNPANHREEVRYKKRLGEKNFSAGQKAGRIKSKRFPLLYEEEKGCQPSRRKGLVGWVVTRDKRVRVQNRDGGGQQKTGVYRGEDTSDPVWTERGEARNDKH